MMDWTINSATATECQTALEWILNQANDSDSDSSHQARDLLAACRKNRISLDGLLIARRQSQVVGAVLGLLQPDGSAHVWPPAVVHVDLQNLELINEVRRRLAESLVEWLRQSGARLAQCLSPIDRVEAHLVLTSVGFEALTGLACWRHPLIDIPHAILPDDCESTPYSEESAERFEAVMTKTYAASQDCQGLQGRRTATECLSAHRLAGSFDSDLWQIFQIDDEDAGIMLSANHRDQHVWELLYLGVIPKYRRQGLGLALVSDLLWNAKISGAEAVLVAVDDSNVAAKSLYEMCGFQAEVSKQIHIWTNATIRDTDSTACAQPDSLDRTA